MHRELKVLVGATVAGVIAVFCLVGSLLAALHSPQPHDLPIGLAGPTQATDQVAAALRTAQPDAFDPRHYDSTNEAEQAVRHRDVAGAFVISPDGARLVVAGGNGLAIHQALQGVFEQVASRTGQQLTVEDVAPLPAGDRLGISPFLGTIAVMISSLLTGVVLALVGSQLGVGAQLGGLVVSALAIGGTAVLVADALVGALTGHPGALFAGLALFSFAVSATVVALVRAVGRAGVPLVFTVMVVLGVPAVGGVAGPEFLPAAYRWLADVLPSSAAAGLVRRVSYFDGHNVGSAVTVLVVWALAAVVILVAAGLLARRRGGTRPETTDPVAQSAALYR